MVKHRHQKDKQYISQSEYKSDWGGKQDPSKAPIVILPFYCCALGLQPFDNPVCTEDGVVYDLLNIVPFLKKYKQCPVTGKPLKTTDLIKLKYHKNQEGDYHDPIAFKVFTENTKIAAIKTSGNVYCYDTIEELNKKPKFMKDLITNQPFTSKDIIILQDPKDITKRTVKHFNFLEKKIDFEATKKPEKVADFINQNDTTKKVLKQFQENQDKENQEKKEKKIKEQQELEELKKKHASNEESTVQEFINQALKLKLYRHTRETTKFQSISVTTTASNQSTGKVEFRPLTENEIRKMIHDEVKGRNLKGYATIKTNLGDLSFRIHANMVPKTCENFLELSQTGYYNNLKFHRLIQDFMIQGGDPTGTGKGGKSIFGEKFEDEFHPKLQHSGPGILAMANSGANTNGSQFYITFADCEHLDNKHSVFGELIGGNPTLYKLNLQPTNKDKPIEDIIIEEVIVHENPFRDMIKLLKQKEKEKQISENTEIQTQKRNERWIENLNGFEIKKKIKTGLEDESEEKNKKQIQSAGIFSKINSLPPPNSQKQKRTGFNFSNW
ncbi:Cyclophilin-like peptidyl-prolyl cis-trans isomerase domain [Pseudocohnilembus persalinus]|uniref:Cyclophilin-like peptidyl-prolyl cis-trans isomerase domain n=1 Tax=Pseudocohnilembus persalinus TaxID=266149 RepID=A0A0V0QF83_PSEPJ|nr:Cyclophilin-like peptidyl-prolyl cis-trans isomerase domain [Pseudocohnilembus persalinus]|eukprot:KRX00867.1 Cyclophilin-like peptidyl-prolyl cis-trans isomerase domain [Pseudocohnilembus persalinus]